MLDQDSVLGAYRLGKTLGTGATAKVKLATHIATGTDYAVKIIRKSEFGVRPDLERKTRREIALMKLLDHPHVLKLVECLESPRHIYLILELGARGELFDLLVSRAFFPRDVALGFFREIVYGLEYLHEYGICHRDLKPENLLLDSHGHIKIADFGFARWMPANIAETSCGSPHYAAPEVLRGLPYDGRKADVWSCGVILFALLAGHLPFDDASIRGLLAKVKCGRFTMSQKIDSDIGELISKMLQLDVDDRATIQEIKKDKAFLAGLPVGYRVPSPIPLVPWMSPIELDQRDASFLQMMVAIGYRSKEEVRIELIAPVHTQVKTFYRMWADRARNIEALPWQAGEVKSFFQDEVFMQMPKAVSDAATSSDEFGRKNRDVLPDQLQSPTRILSLAQPMSWTIRGVFPSEPLAFHNIEVGLPVLMHAIQLMFADLGFEYFYPSELELIARRPAKADLTTLELIVRILAEFVSETVVTLKVYAILGEDPDFELFTDQLRTTIDALK
jgi:BR serine/threonine kinase